MIEAPGQRASVPPPPTADRVDPGHSGRIVDQIAVRPVGDGPPLPGHVRVHRDSGPGVVPRQARSADGSSITAFVAPRPGESSLSVDGRQGTTGPFVVAVGPAGAVTGDFRIDRQDIAATVDQLRPRPAEATAATPRAAPRGPPVPSLPCLALAAPC